MFVLPAEIEERRHELRKCEYVKTKFIQRVDEAQWQWTNSELYCILHGGD